MKRREFVRALSAAAGTAWLSSSAFPPAFAQSNPTAAPLPLTINYDKPGNLLPANFTGLGYEISSIARKGLLSPRNAVYLQLVRSLGRSGVIRIGGNTSDFSRFAANGPSASSPKQTVVSANDLRDLGGFLQASGWQLIWGLNLGNQPSPENLANALDEAEAVVKIAGPRLLALEIGNEPDLFWVEHRPKPYTYNDFRRDYQPLRDALLRRLPDVPLAGPDVAGATDWVGTFAGDERRNLRLLTRHYYRGSQSPRSTSAMLLGLDPTLPTMLSQMNQASLASGLPFRLCEVNSFSGGGRPGVSDTFAEALWVLDYMLRIASGGASGVNIETGVNQLGFISSYSPIADDEHDRYAAAPGFYGMLAFAQIGEGHLLPVTLPASPLNVVAYAVERPAGETVVILINREPATPATLQLPQPPDTHATVIRLEAPSLSATGAVTLGGVSVSPSGAWHAPRWPDLQPTGSAFEINLAPASAALIRLTRAS